MKKSITLTFITTALVLTSCGSSTSSGNDLQASLLPKTSIGVSSTPAETLGSCTPVTEVSFVSPSKIKTKDAEFTLLGLYDTEEFSAKESTLTPKLNEFAAKIFCLKQDPGVEDKNLVYAFSPENTLINSELIRGGLAGAKKDINFIYKDYFVSLNEEAKANKAGIYAPSSTQPKDDSQVVVQPGRAYQQISPAEAKLRVGQIVSIVMTVGSVGQGNTAIYFNSEKDYSSQNNVAGVIQLPAKNSILDNLVRTAKNYEGQKVKITGTVVLSGDKPQIIISDHTQLELAK